MIARSAIVAEAATWARTPERAGTRYQHQGRAKGVGVDCIGLVGMTALACGVEGAKEWRADHNMHNYGPQPQPEYLWKACERFLERIALATASLGDLLVMAFPRQPQHFAIISRVEPTYVIHAYLQRRMVVEQSLPIAKATLLRAYRFRGVA